jgi:hypothetical protein
MVTVAMDRRPQSPGFRKAYDHRTPVHVAVVGRVRRLLTRGESESEKAVALPGLTGL